MREIFSSCEKYRVGIRVSSGERKNAPNEKSLARRKGISFARRKFWYRPPVDPQSRREQSLNNKTNEPPEARNASMKLPYKVIKPWNLYLWSNPRSGLREGADNSSPCKIEWETWKTGRHSAKIFNLATLMVPRGYKSARGTLGRSHPK